MNRIDLPEHFSQETCFEKISGLQKPAWDLTPGTTFINNYIFLPKLS